MNGGVKGVICITANQINYAKLREEKRANAAREAIEAQANIEKRIANQLLAEKQAEDRRHNLVGEQISSMNAYSQAQSAAANASQARTAAGNLAVSQGRLAMDQSHESFEQQNYGLKYGSNLSKTSAYFTSPGGAWSGAQNIGNGAYSIYTKIKNYFGGKTNGQEQQKEQRTGHKLSAEEREEWRKRREALQPGSQGF